MSQLWNNLATTAKLGGAYLEHSQFLKTTLLAPPEQRGALVAQYQRSLTPAGLIGFKLCLQFVAMREKDSATKAALVALMEGAQVGFTDFLTTTVAAVRDPAGVPDDDAALAQDCAYFETLLGMASDAEREQELARHVATLDRNGLARFGMHLNKIESHITDQINAFSGGDASAWGNSFEDRAAYGMAHLRAPAPHPSTSPRLAHMHHGLAVIQQMKGARSRAAFQGQMSKLVTQSSDAIGRIAAALTTRGSRTDEPAAAVAATVVASNLDLRDIPGGADPRVSRLVDLFTGQDRAAQLRFLADCPDVPVKPNVLAIFGIGERRFDFAALLLLSDPYCRGVDPAQGIAIAKAVFIMAQAAADAAPSGDMVDAAAQAAIVVLLGYSNLRAATDPVTFGAEASAWLDRHGYTDRRVPLLLSRIEAHMRLDQFGEAGALLTLAATLEIPADQPAEGPRLARLQQEFARRAATDATTMRPETRSEADTLTQDREQLAEMVKGLRAQAANWPAAGPLSGLNPQVEQIAAVADELDALIATSTAATPLEFAQQNQGLSDRMVAIQNGGGEAMTPAGNRNRIVKASLFLGDSVRGHDPAEIEASLAVLLEARHWSLDNDCVDDEAWALWPMYLCYNRSNRPEQAIETLQSLRASLERQRAQIAEPRKRAGAMLDYPRLFPELCRLLHDAGRTAELLDAIEGAKGRLSADVLTRATGTAVADGAFRVSAEALNATLAPLDAHYLTYLVDDDVTYAVLVAKNGSLHAKVVPIGRAALRGLAGAINPEVWGTRPLGAFSAKVAALPAQAAALVDWLEPLIDAGVIAADDQLCYCPDDVLHLVPLHYLPVAGVPLVRHVSLSRIHSGAALQALLSRAPERPTRFVAVQVPAQEDLADPIKVEALAQVPRWLAANLTGTVLEGPAADHEALADLNLKGRLVHFATHGTFPAATPDNPFDTAGLLLASDGAPPSLAAVRNGEQGNALLTPAQILQKDFDFAGAHVTLQGCVTGLSRDGVGGDAIGLDLALLLAGARSLLSTHWEVQDEQSAAFSLRFYDHWLLQGRSRAAAWRHTILDLADGALASDRPPEYYWASTSLSGDFR